MNKDFFYGRKVLVTGASSGIGKDTALLFAKNGYSVFGVSRRIEEKREDYGEGSVTYLKMDVTEKESIQRVLDTIGDFSILIHSAGFGIAGSAEDSDISLVRLQEETDYYGVLLLNSLALPVLRRQEEKRLREDSYDYSVMEDTRRNRNFLVHYKRCPLGNVRRNGEWLMDCINRMGTTNRDYSKVRFPLDTYLTI